EHAGPAVAEADELVTEVVDALADDAADHRVEAGAVAAAGEEPDAHGAAMYWGPPCDGPPGDHALAGSGSRGSCEIRGSQSSRLGRYQFHSPSSFIAAGSRTPRTRVASSRTAVARPTPIILNSIMLSVPKIENTATITTAALVTTPAVCLMP